MNVDLLQKDLQINCFDVALAVEQAHSNPVPGVARKICDHGVTMCDHGAAQIPVATAQIRAPS